MTTEAGNAMTLDELTNACGYWQEKLGLSHWEIQVAIARKNQINKENIGENEFSLASEQSLISILDPVDYDFSFPQDMEETLVHELLHIPLQYFANPEEGSLEWNHMEAAISRLAKALVSLKRETKIDTANVPKEGT